MDAFDAFKQEVEVKLKGMTKKQWREQHPGKHLYARYRDYMACALCGRVKPRRRSSPPCPGVTYV